MGLPRQPLLSRISRTRGPRKQTCISRSQLSSGSSEGLRSQQSGNSCAPEVCVCTSIYTFLSLNPIYKICAILGLCPLPFPQGFSKHCQCGEDWNHKTPEPVRGGCSPHSFSQLSLKESASTHFLLPYSGLRGQGSGLVCQHQCSDSEQEPCPQSSNPKASDLTVPTTIFLRIYHRPSNCTINRIGREELEFHQLSI